MTITSYSDIFKCQGHLSQVASIHGYRVGILVRRTIPQICLRRATTLEESCYDDVVVTNTLYGTYAQTVEVEKNWGTHLGRGAALAAAGEYLFEVFYRCHDG